MKLRLRPTKKVMAVLGVVAVLGMALAWVVHRQQTQQRAQLQAQLETKRKEADEVETAARQLPESERELKTIQARLSLLRESKPKEFQPDLVLAMHDLAKQSGIELAMFNPSEPPTGAKSPIDRLEKKDIAPHQYLSISSTVEGSFHSVSQFMYRLSGLPKIVSIDTVQMQPATQAPPDHVRCILQMTAYITKELQPKTMAAAVKLKEIAEAEEKYKAKHQTYGKLADLNSEGLLSLKEGETVEGYTFITDASTGKTTFKILAGTKEPNLHNLSMDQAKKIMDETDKVAYE